MLRGPNRRQFLKFSAAVTAGAALPENLKRALAISAHPRTEALHHGGMLLLRLDEHPYWEN
ncbi:MAG: twin-arginine translocation signal domain-containing protein [Acetobacter persici]